MKVEGDWSMLSLMAEGQVGNLKMSTNCFCIHGSNNNNNSSNSNSRNLAWYTHVSGCCFTEKE